MLLCADDFPISAFVRTGSFDEIPFLELVEVVLDCPCGCAAHICKLYGGDVSVIPYGV